MISITIKREEIDRLIDAVSMLFGYNSFDKYVNDRIDYKINKDKRYSYDNGSMRKRIITDGYSEIMLLRFSSGLFRPNFEIGQSYRYNKPDFDYLGLNLGLKTVRGKNAHLIQKPENIKYPELMTRLFMDEDYVKYEILGIADEHIMSTYGDVSLVKSKSARSYKNGFNRYDLLRPIYCFNDLL